MAKYHENFRLSPIDVEIIERAIRSEIAVCARVEPQHEGFNEARMKARAMNEVLGKIFNQKVFYSQVNDTGVPVA